MTLWWSRKKGEIVTEKLVIKISSVKMTHTKYCQFHRSTGNHYSSQCSRNPLALSTKLPTIKIHNYPVRSFSMSSLTSTQDNTANNDEIICAADNQLGPHPIMYAASSSSS